MSFANQALVGRVRRRRTPPRSSGKVYDVPEGDRRRDRAAQARDDGHRHRPAHRGAGEVPRLVGRRDMIAGEPMVPPRPPSPRARRAVRARRAKPGSGRYRDCTGVTRGLEPERIVRLEDDAVVLLDQRRLPDEEVELRCASAAEVADAIRDAGDSRRAGDRHRRRVRATRWQRRAARTSTRRTRRSRRRARRRSTSRWALEEMRADPTPERARALHEEEVERCRRMARARRRARRLRARASSRTATPAGSPPVATERRSGALRSAWEHGLRRARLGRRDAAAAPGSAPDRLGARDARHPARRDRRRRGRVAHGRGRGRLRRSPAPTASPRTATPRTRSARTRSRSPRPTTDSRSTSSRRPRHSTSTTRDRRRHPDRGARRDRGHDSLPGAQPGVRRHAGGADHRDRDRGGRPPRAVRRLASDARSERADVIDGLDRQTAETLERFGFEPDLFETLRTRVATGDLSPRSNVVQGRSSPLTPTI